KSTSFRFGDIGSIWIHRPHGVRKHPDHIDIISTDFNTLSNLEVIDLEVVRVILHNSITVERAYNKEIIDLNIYSLKSLRYGLHRLQGIFPPSRACHLLS